MGFLRGVAKALVGLIFLVLLSGLLMNVTLYESTRQDFLKPLFMTILGQGSASQDFSSVYNDAVSKCKTQASYNPPIENMTLSIECSKINSMPRENFSRLIMEELFDQKLYNNPCYGLDCLKMQDIPGFATKGFNLFLNDIFLYVLIATAVFGLFLFLLSEGWASKFSSIGVPILINGLPYIALIFYRQKIQIGDFQVFADKLIEVMSKYMLAYLVVGGILVIISIIIRIASAKKVKPKKSKKKKK